ncbi:RxLR effector protein [Phytophthora megakarya]|uniref:RxLR effector protein n=1 Tax=Phytophthora megakarya TaxID=4795 RepID=A0A225V2T2_9STRA|nr:RxLR effector protein [Phytophthora megakarya]
MSKRLHLINEVKAEFSMRFKMEVLGFIHYILKMEVRRNRVEKIMPISQHQYVLELLKKYMIENSSVVATTQITGLELEPETNMTAEQIAAQKFDYRGLVGSLEYLVESSKYLSCYNKTHRRVLKYLKGTSTYDLLLDGKLRDVTDEVYKDASFVCQSKECKSVTGFVIKMGGCRIYWYSSKQVWVLFSTTEAKLIALSEGAKESEWL